MSTTGELGWFKSGYSGSEGGSCVEVAYVPGTVYVRDSKEMDGPRFAVNAIICAGFIRYAAGRLP